MKTKGFRRSMVTVAIISLLLVLVSGCGNNKKLVCKSPEGNITITYNDKTLVGYSANGISFDLDGQKEVAEILGTDGYADSFTDWFTSNTSGDCTKE